MNPSFDAHVLRDAASKLYARARYVAIVYALIGACVGGAAGGGTILSLNVARRVNQIRHADELAEITGLDDREDELRSAFRHVPLAILSVGILFAAAGLIAGWRKAFELRTQAQIALGIAELHR